MTSNSLSDMSAVVTGASRGFGAGIAEAFVAAGLTVVGIARDKQRFHALGDQLGGGFIPVAGEVVDPDLAVRVISEFRPQAMVLNAGATPVMNPIQQHTWETLQPRLGCACSAGLYGMILVSSGAAVAGSPLSGGYSGAKATITFIASYAARESARNHLGIRFATLTPLMT